MVRQILSQRSISLRHIGFRCLRNYLAQLRRDLELSLCAIELEEHCAQSSERCSLHFQEGDTWKLRCLTPCRTHSTATRTSTSYISPHEKNALFCSLQLGLSIKTERFFSVQLGSVSRLWGRNGTRRLGLRSRRGMRLSNSVSDVVSCVILVPVCGTFTSHLVCYLISRSRSCGVTGSSLRHISWSETRAILGASEELR